MSQQPVLIGGRWRAAHCTQTFQAEDPTQQMPLSDLYPVSQWSDCEEALQHAAEAASLLRNTPAEKPAAFLERFAERIEARKAELVAMAHAETALPAAGRLGEVELPRTAGQLRQAAQAARDGSWTLPTIDTKLNIRSCLTPIGPVCVFGPNNFPFAFNSVSGGDFAAAIASGNPVIAKANTSHPGTTRLLAEEALRALEETKLPASTVQMLYRLSHEDGERLVSDHRVGAIGYTGSRSAGLKLKAAADLAGKPIYLELSSINPVVVLPGAIRERGDQLAAEFTASCLMGTGQFCTNPGLVLLLAGEKTDAFIASLKEKFQHAPVGTLLSAVVAKNLTAAIAKLQSVGAKLLVGGTSGGGKGYSHANTLLSVTAQDFLKFPPLMQTEAFGNSSLLVVARDIAEAVAVLNELEGNLTGCIYSHTAGEDDNLYPQAAAALLPRVGRLLNDKMPTGVAVSPAMNHGGPFPATGHPGFTAVGIPASLRRFGMLSCFDNVRPHRLPPLLKNENPNGKVWRMIDGAWTQGNVTPSS